MKITGLKAEYFNSLQPGEHLKKQRVVNEINESYTFISPDSNISADHYSIRFTGFLNSVESGYFQLALEGNDGFRLFVDEQLVIDQWEKISYRQKGAQVYLEKGKQYALRVEFYESKGNGSIKFLWNQGVFNQSLAMINQAVEIAQQADMAIIVAGIHEGEFQDRSSLSLPEHQEKLIAAVAATGKPVVVLLVGGSAITMEKWINQVKSIMMVWYPGEEGGNAIAELLFGDENPAGRLPITFPQSVGQVPMVYNHKPTGRGDDYHDLSGEPLFPFGFGLSYTQFKYSSIQLSKDTLQGKNSVQLSVDIANVGSRVGEEVVQLYIRDERSSVATPVLALKDFQRVSIAAGDYKTFYFNIDSSKLSLINKNGLSVTEPGLYRLMIGSNSRYLPLKKNLVYIQ
jgi:beta-glucosidase